MCVGECLGICYKHVFSPNVISLCLLVRLFHTCAYYVTVKHVPVSFTRESAILGRGYWRICLGREGLFRLQCSK